MTKCCGCDLEVVAHGRRGPRPRWCSDRCRIAASRRTGPGEAKSCRECGRSFASRRSDQVFCDPACKESWWVRMKLAQRQHKNLRTHSVSDPAVFRGGRAALEWARESWPEYLDT